MAERSRRRRHQAGRAGAAARCGQRDADRSERRPARRRLPRRHLRRLAADIAPSPARRRPSCAACTSPFVSPVFFPGRMWSPNYFGALAGSGGTQLLVTPAQHRVAEPRQPERARSASSRTSNLRLLLQRRSQPGGAVRCAVDRQRRSATGRRRRASSRRRSSAIPRRRSTGVDHLHRRRRPRRLDVARPRPVRRAACRRRAARSRTRGCGWAGCRRRRPTSSIIVQAVNGVGLVAVDDNRGAYYGVGGSTPAATTLALVSPPTAATIGDSVNFTARLELRRRRPGRRQDRDRSRSAATTKFGTTGRRRQRHRHGAGRGRSRHLPDHRLVCRRRRLPVVVDHSDLRRSTRRSASLAGLAPAGRHADRDVLGGTTQALPAEGVTFSVTGPAGPTTIWAITDYLGRAVLPPPGLPAGTYTVTNASFGGNATFAAANLTFAPAQEFTVAKIAQNFAFGELADTTYGAPLRRCPAPPAPACRCRSRRAERARWRTIWCRSAASEAARSPPVRPATTSMAPSRRSRARSPSARRTRRSPSGRPRWASRSASRWSRSARPARARAAPPSTIPITFNSLTPFVCTVGGGINSTFVTLVGAGVCTIAANQGGSEVFNAAPQATLDFAVAAATTAAGDVHRHQSRTTAAPAACATRSHRPTLRRVRTSSILRMA